MASAHGPHARGSLHVGLVAPPFLPVPPPAYGGTERVLADLAKELVQRGHRVSLVASGDSTLPDVELHACYRASVWPPNDWDEQRHASFAAERLEGLRVDVVHSHVPCFTAFARRLRIPVVHTLHHDASPALSGLYASAGDVRFVCISARQRLLVGLLAGLPAGLPPGLPAAIEWSEVVHHGLDPSRHPFGAGESGRVLFLGRFDAVKAPHLAVEAARTVGLGIDLAGRPHEERYARDVLTPALTRADARVVGEIGGARKAAWLGSGLALLFTSVWEEPFGLAAIEAMLCGTPVVALRRGALPEIVDEGVTGLLVERPEDLPAALTRTATFDRRRVRERARERFSASRMTADYEAIYRRAIEAGKCGGESR